MDTQTTRLKKSDQIRRQLLARIEARECLVGVIGMGYVGLPLAIAFGGVAVRVLGFDIDPSKATALNAGKSYFKHIPDDLISKLRSDEKLEGTANMGRLGECDAILVCVPTPLTRHLEPDLSYVRKTTEQIASQLRPGQIVVLESTTYPGTTHEVMRPILERTGLKAGVDFFLAYSPEREDPGNADYSTSQIPKVVGADDDASREIANALYGLWTPKLVPVSSTATAEAVKITENVFRAVNIALVNELKLVFEAMGIDVWEVIDAAKTKPFGFMPFYPGPGLGGHCIPIDPFYLTWKAREYNQYTRFIELAGQINATMPEHVVAVLAAALDERFARGLNGARVLVLGVAYKKNVDDIRESPALRLIELVEARGAIVEFFDPYVNVIGVTREHPTLIGRRSVDWTADLTRSFDCVLVATDHDVVDYAHVAQTAKLVVDTRNACARRTKHLEKVIRA